MKLSGSNDRRPTSVVANSSDKLHGHPAFPGCFKEEQEPDLFLLDISDLGPQLEHSGWRAKDE
jgi:hypothetical protein